MLAIPRMTQAFVALLIYLGRPAAGAVLQNTTLTLANATFNTVEIEYIPSYFYLSHSETNATLAPVRERISYFVRDGLAIIEGDVIVGTEADVLASRVDADEDAEGVGSERSRKRSLSIFPGAPLGNPRKWPNGRFEYKWSTAAAKTKRGPGFEAAVKLWTDRVPSLQFVEVGPPSETLTAGGAITLQSVDDDISSSPAGRAMNVRGDRFVAEINMMILGNCGDLATCAYIYAHEIGHSK